MKTKPILLLLVTALIFILLSGGAYAEEAPESRSLLVYVLGGDLESDSGAATDDLMEILHATLETEQTIYAHLGGSQTWWMAGLENGRCYDLELCGGKMAILQKWEEEESASATALACFLAARGKDGDDLILWGHGDSKRNAIGYDALHNADWLGMDELQEALKTCGLHFRMIGLDACQMATSDAVRAVENYAKYFAASEEEEALSGWDYRQTLLSLAGDETFLADSLRKNVLQAARRDPALAPLTVLELEKSE